jgi:hypothetical protein
MAGRTSCCFLSRCSLSSGSSSRWCSFELTSRLAPRTTHRSTVCHRAIV